MAKKKILIIDDDLTGTELVKDILAGTGDYEVHTETESSKSVRTAKKIKPDLILLDIMMPHINGFKILELLKKDHQTVSIPVIMLSALTSDEEKLRAVPLYNEAYMEKPIDSDILIKTIAEILKRNCL